MGNSNKSSSRLFSVQILYEMEINGKSFEKIKKRFSEESFFELEDKRKFVFQRKNKKQQ